MGLHFRIIARDSLIPQNPTTPSFTTVRFQSSASKSDIFAPVSCCGGGCPNHKPRPGALAGHYAGATASAALGVGAGANVLIGGFNNSIALQPVAIEARNGLNVAAGIAELDLHFVSAVKVQ